MITSRLWWRFGHIALRLHLDTIALLCFYRAGHFRIVEIDRSAPGRPAVRLTPVLDLRPAEQRLQLRLPGIE